MKKLLSLLALLLFVGGGNLWAIESHDFNAYCQAALSNKNPVTVTSDGDAGFTINDKEMHFLANVGGYDWKNRFAYEYNDNKKVCWRKNGSTASGLFSWDYAHYFSVLNLKDGDKVTITLASGTVKLISDNVDGLDANSDIKSGTTYTIKTSEATTRLDLQMQTTSYIKQIVIEPFGEVVIPDISVMPATVKLVPGATYTLTSTVLPNNKKGDTEWVSSDTGVATVDADGKVTAVAGGTATISCQWKEDSSVKAEATITVANVELAALTVVKAYDFTAMGNVTLELESAAAGAIWNEANSRNNNVFFCKNTGLEYLAVQAALDSSKKGWSIVDGEGLQLGSGAGRCAAIGGIRKGQIVEIFYTGNSFYTRSDDAGIEKTTLNESAGRAIYQADEDGMIGFELVKGNYVKSINIYALTTDVAVATEYATYCGTQAVDFTFVEGLEAYVIASATGTSAVLQKVTEVPANTGVLLKKTGAATSFQVPIVETAAAPAANLLVGTTAAKTLAAGEAYLLKGGKFGKSEAGTLAAGKAYLPADAVPSGARELNLVFGETTAIQSVKAAQAEGTVYNLAGQRVAAPAKGLYIIGGKKVIVK